MFEDHELPDDGLTTVELSAYLRILAHHETEEIANLGEFRRFRRRAFLRGRASALWALAELVERGEIRANFHSSPVLRLHLPTLDVAMPDD